MVVMLSLSKEDKAFFLDLARKAIKEYLEKGTVYEPKAEEIPELGFEKLGNFVSLHIKKELRGCIGTIIPQELLYKEIIHNALHAAFDDPRFVQVNKKELKEIEIEISLLSKPEEIKHEEIKEKKHGIVLEYLGQTATFLPQVWGVIPDKKEFLEQLSLKAGLQKDAWKKAKLKYYTALVFSEKE